VKAPDTDVLREAIGHIFDREVLSFHRHRSPYSSSFAIEELDIRFPNRERITVVFKNLGSEAILEEARSVRPAFLQNSLREIQVYDKVLSLLNVGTPDLYGTVVDPSLGRYWLFIEKVPGIELYQVGDFEVWLEAARWLGRFHSLEACNAGRALASVPALLQHSPAFYRTWLDRALISAGKSLEPVVQHYERVLDVLDSLPVSIIHGEFYAANILIQEDTGRRVCPVDWEMAAIGPGLLDVANLASGKWTREQRSRILDAYCSTLPGSARVKDLITAFDCCQLQVALQWLGWSVDWAPPPEHAHDWLAEVTQLCAEEPLRRLLR